MKKLVLLGMSMFVLGACGNNVQEQVEADVDSSTVVSSEEVAEGSSSEEIVESESSSEKTTVEKLEQKDEGEDFLSQSTKTTIQELQSLTYFDQFSGHEDSEGASYEEVVELLGESGYRSESESDGTTSMYATWESPRNGSGITMDFSDGKATAAYLLSEKSDLITDEEFNSVSTDGSFELENALETLGIPTRYSAMTSNGYTSSQLEYEMGNGKSATISFDDGVATGKSQS